MRLHRAGEGAPYSGLKPAGLSVGPVIPLAERAIDEGTVQPLADYLTSVLREELDRRLGHAQALARLRGRSVEDAREYVEAMLGFEVYTHHLYQAIRTTDHHESTGHAHVA